ncbi:MAG TPA: NADH-quinone oxidoreductase subunit NuoN [Woeseiaceae bacterium]|jgi:NADH-quinone oxidoreductase subunit N|nr:NADH-quinone oxidoreductase subunit NuoN [Woeseiaceae bacterium]
MSWTDLMPAAPEAVLLALICAVLVADLFVDDARRAITYWLSIGALAVTAIVLIATAPDARTLLFGNTYVSDALSQVLKLASVILVAATFTYARSYLTQNGLLKGEFYTLGMFGLLGMMIMMSANGLLTMYLGLETLALSQYSLVAFDRDSRDSSESAMKYFVLGAIASGALLYGISWTYGVTGSLVFDDIAAALRAHPDMNDLPLWFGIAFMLVGIAFKFGAVPFHMWLPDVYNGARTPVTLYLAAAPKLAALALIIRIFAQGLAEVQEVWQGMVMVLAVLSLVVGNVVAIAQSNIKRMLGYSTIAHVGFILAAVFCGTDDGYAAALFYAITYVIMATGSFAMVILLSRKGFEAENLSDFKGLNARSPWFAAMMLFFMFGLTGVPPWVGFFAKLNAIEAVLEVDYPALAVLMVLASVVGAYYYLRVVWYMYFDQPQDRSVLQAGLDTRVVLSLNGLAVLLLGILPGWLLQLCLDAFI